MQTRKVVNIINFVRGVEPRHPDMDLFRPVIEEMKLNKQYGFPNTFLLQYDAMLRPDFQALFREEKDDNMELGIWIEIVRPLTEAVGIPWRGRPGYDWDWYVDPGFLPAYEKKERERLIDEIMRLFHSLYGYYPKSVGSWLLDSYSMDYMSRVYHISAFAICREQYAVDAYTLWGGYYNQGYYPSKNNMLCPALTKEAQIQTPVFRMLGIDPIYGYDEQKVLYPRASSGSCTLEPVWNSGQNPFNVQWFFDSYFKTESMNFAYVQVGQENSFSWNSIEKGLPTQLAMLNTLVRENQVIVEKLCETGEWFKSTFDRTPATSLVALTDHTENGIQSVWYDCQFYRSNLLLYQNELFFRDIFKFDECFCERYDEEPCRERDAVYENLPVVDGRLWSKDNTVSKLAFDVTVSELRVQRTSENELEVTAISGTNAVAVVHFAEDGITVTGAKPFVLNFRRGQSFDTDITVDNTALHFSHRDFRYTVPINGTLSALDGDAYRISSEGERIKLIMNR